MVMPVLVRRAVKTVYFMALFLPVGRALGPADGWFSYVWAKRIGEMLYGPDEIGQDSLYEIYTYIGMMTILLIATVIYLLTVTLLNEIRK